MKQLLQISFKFSKTLVRNCATFILIASFILILNYFIFDLKSQKLTNDPRIINSTNKHHLSKKIIEFREIGLRSDDILVIGYPKSGKNRSFILLVTLKMFLPHFFSN